MFDWVLNKPMENPKSYISFSALNGSEEIASV